MQYGSTMLPSAVEGKASGEKESEGVLQVSAREASAHLFDLVARLDRVVNRIRLAPPQPVENGKNSASPGTLDSVLSNIATNVVKAHELMTEIEHLYLPTMKGTIEEIRTQLDAAREVPIEAKEFLRKMLTITDPKHKYWRLDLTIHAQNGGTNGGWTISKL